jgi:hypothetical protein
MMDWALRMLGLIGDTSAGIFLMINQRPQVVVREVLQSRERI